jgi:TPR repeat protein
MIKVVNKEKYIQLFNEAENNDADSQYELGNYYYDGLELNGQIYFKQDKLKGFNWIKRAFENGSIIAMIRMADFYSEGEICLRNESLAIKLYEKGIAEGYSYSANNLATIYRDRKDFKKAFELYHIAQRLDKSNVIQLAYCYYYGIGTTVDKEKAVEIFERIVNDNSENRNCDYDVEDANYYLGLTYLDGTIVKKSLKRARLYFEKAIIDKDHRSANDILLLIGRSRE